MIYKHIKSGKLYRMLFKSFSVERQEVSVVYVQVDTGYTFDRDWSAFQTDFILVDDSPQFNIIPNDPDHKVNIYVKDDVV